MLGLDDLKSQSEEKVEVGKPEEPTGRVEPTPGIDARDLDMLAVGRAVGMETLEHIKKNEGRVQQVMEWARQKGATDQLGYVAEVKGLMHRLGTRSIHDLYVYTRLDMDRMATESKMRKMEKPL